MNNFEKLVPSRESVRFLKLILAIGATWWAVALFWPGDTTSRPTYKIMHMIMGDIGWGLVFTGVAILQWIRAFYCRSHRWYSQMLSAICPVVWSFTTISMILSVYPPASAIAGEVCLTIISGVIYIVDKPQTDG